MRILQKRRRQAELSGSRDPLWDFKRAPKAEPVGSATDLQGRDLLIGCSLQLRRSSGVGAMGHGLEEKAAEGADRFPSSQPAKEHAFSTQAGVLHEMSRGSGCSSQQCLKHRNTHVYA